MLGGYALQLSGRRGISLADAEGALYDPMALTREDASSIAERRFVTIASDHLERVVVVVVRPYD